MKDGRCPNDADNNNNNNNNVFQTWCDTNDLMICTYFRLHYGWVDKNNHTYILWYNIYKSVD